MAWIIFHLEMLTATYFQWLSFYILSRALLTREKTHWWQRTDVQAGLAILLVSLFMVGVGMRYVSGTEQNYILWEKFTWWSLPVLAFLWLRTSFLLPHNPESPPRLTRLQRLLVWGVGGYAAVLVWMSLYTDLIFRYDAIETRATTYGRFFLSPGAAYKGYAIYFLTVLLGVTLLMYLRWRKSGQDEIRERQFKFLFTGNLLMLTGSTLSIFSYLLWDGRIPAQVGDLLAAFGLFFVGRALVQDGALIPNPLLTTDYRRSFLVSLSLILLSLFILHGMHRVLGDQPLTWLSIPLVISVADIATVFFPLYQDVISGFTLPAWEARFYKEMASLRRELLTAEDPQMVLEKMREQMSLLTDQAIEDQTFNLIEGEIQRIFQYRTFHDDEVMSGSRLFSLRSVRTFAADGEGQGVPIESLSHFQRAELLRRFLSEIIEGHYQAWKNQKPEGDTIPDQQLEYIVIKQGYMQGLTRKEVSEHIEAAVGLRIPYNSRAYTRLLDQGRRRLIEAIWSREQGDQGTS